MFISIYFLLHLACKKPCFVIWSLCDVKKSFIGVTRFLVNQKCDVCRLSESSGPFIRQVYKWTTVIRVKLVRDGANPHAVLHWLLAVFCVQLWYNFMLIHNAKCEHSFRRSQKIFPWCDAAFYQLGVIEKVTGSEFPQISLHGALSSHL